MLSTQHFLQIVYRVWNVYNDFLYLEDDARHYLTYKGVTRQDLAALRLVNRAFCRSASPWLNRHINPESSSSPAIPSLERFMRLSKSPYATYFCKIDFGFKKSLSSDAGTLYIEDLAECQSSLLIKFTNLRALEFHEPPSSLHLLQPAASAICDIDSSPLRSMPCINSCFEGARLGAILV